MAFDAHKNFAVSSVAVAPSPAASGTSLTVASGEAARFPAAPFNATVCPIGALATPANAEIVRVVSIAGDVLTITRAQEFGTARAIAVGDLIAATITAKTLTDLEPIELPWTPALGGSTSDSGVTAAVTGQYTKIGRTVWANFEIYLSALGSIVGNVIIKGLPFVAASGMTTGYSTGVVAFYAMAAPNWTYLHGEVMSNTSYIQLFGIGAPGTSNLGGLVQADLTNATIFRGSVWYRANQ